MTTPEAWTKVKLSQIADIGWGDLSVTKKSYVESGYTAFSATGADGYLPYFDYDQDGIVVSAIGANCGKIWRAYGKWSCIKNTMRIIIKEAPVSLDYLYYFLSDPKVFPKRGSGQPFISKEDARDIEIAYPPIDEQRKIVELLEDHLSRLDAALADVKQARIKAAQFRQSLLNSVYCESELHSVSLGTCIDLIMGQAPPGNKCNKDGEGTPFVKVGEFAKLYPTIEEWTLKPLRLAKAGDVLICVVGATVGKINLGIDCAIGRSVAAIRPKNVLLQKYLYYFLELKMLEIRGQSKGSAQGVITKDYINSIQIPLPELSAQQTVLDLLESNFSQIEKSIEVSDKIERESLSLRRSLLQAAFTGQLAKEVASV